MRQEIKPLVAIVTQQYSIVVKGIEKKLDECGYQVRVMGEKIAEIRNHADRAEMFIIYLQENVQEDAVKSASLHEVLDVLREKGKYILSIGENKNKEQILQKFPALRGSMWIDRPVELDRLIVAVTEVHEIVNYDMEDADLWEVEEIAGAKEPEPAPVVESKRILIVDDDPSYAKMVREWLKDVHHVDIVTAGMQAITFLLKNPVDLILLDYEMPVVDGPQVMQMLHSEPSTANIPVVFLTGVGTRESVSRVMALKPAGYVLKTTTREELLNNINGLFRKMQG